MKKIVAVLFLTVCSYAYSQSVKLFSVDENRWLNPIDTVSIDISPTVGSGDFYLNIANTSTDTIKLMIKRTLLSLLSGAENEFCFGACFGVNGNETISSYDFLPGDTLFYDDTNNLYAFHTTYYPNGQKGISFIQYTFYNEKDKLGAKTNVIFKFNSGSVGIKNITEAASFRVYPNPTTGQLIIDNGQLTTAPLSHPEGGKQPTIEIFNVVGQVVFKSHLSKLSPETSIDLSHLANGMYFLKIDNKTFKIIKN